MKKILFLMVLLLFGCVERDLPPEPEVPGAPIGKALDVYDGTGYAPPWDIFNDNQTIFTVSESSDITDKNIRLSLSADQNGGYIYKYGYIYTKDGWQLYNFDEATVGNSRWIADSASVVLDELKSNLLPDQYFVVAYSCQKVGGEWKCGCVSENECNYWMLEDFSVLQCCWEETDCEDSIDNDCDGFVDMEDSDCLPSEPVFYTSGWDYKKQITSAADPLEIGEPLGSVISTLTSSDLNILNKSVFINQEGSFEYKQYMRLDWDTFLNSNNGDYFFIAFDIDNLENDINKEVNDYISSLGFARINSPYEEDFDYIKGYLSMMDNFSDLNFESVEEVFTTLKVRNVQDNIRGYEIDDKNYAVHLLGCDNDISCAFRINGIPTRKLREGDIFGLSDEYSLRIDSILIDYCDEKIYCDLYYESYDVVNVSTVRVNNDHGIPKDYLHIKNGGMIFEYELSFSTSAKSDIVNGRCVDFEDKRLTMLGEEYEIVSTNCNYPDVKLNLVKGSVRDTLEEGEIKTYIVDGVEYEVNPRIVDSTNIKVALQINGGEIIKLDEGEIYVMDNGMIIVIADIIPNEEGGLAPDFVTFYLDAEMMVLQDTIIDNASVGSQTLKINGEIIEDAKITIRGRNISDTRIGIDRFNVVTNADDDLYVAKGNSISSQMHEPQSLFTQNWDITYGGLSDVETNDIRLSPDENNPTQYVLSFKTESGEDSSVIVVDGEELVTENGAIINIAQDGENSLLLSVTTTGDRIDDSVVDEVITIRIDSTEGQLHADVESIEQGFGLRGLQRVGSTNVYEAMTNYGVHITKIDNGADPEEIILKYPKEQIEPIVYVVGGKK